LGTTCRNLEDVQYNRNYGTEFVVLRFSEIYGIGKRARHGTIAIYGNMIENAMLGAPSIIPRGGDEKVDMVYVKDVANSIVLSCFAHNIKHHVYNIGTGVGYSLEDVAEAIRKIYPGAVFNIGPGLDYLGFGRAYFVLDISRTKNDLGYIPEFMLEAGVRDYIKSMKKLGIQPAATSWNKP
jgi:UDP-glucose 4-epimerase